MVDLLARIYWKNMALGAAFAAGMVALSFYSGEKVDRLKRERDARGVFVVGTALREDNNLKGAFVVDYAYCFAGRRYINSIATNKWLDGRLGRQRGRFYVRLAVPDPTNAELLFDDPVPGSIVTSPDSGWMRIPQFIDDSLR